MPNSSYATHWTVILGAASGDRTHGEEFARRYKPAVEAYFGARWRKSPLRQEIDDATQEVFVDLLRDGGALQRVDPKRRGGFRAYLYGIARIVALRIEQRAGRRKDRQASSIDVPTDDDALEQVFDRAWASALMTQAAKLQMQRATTTSAKRRFELLRLRFEDGLPIREIAARWDVDAKVLHHEYPKARGEFRRALLDCVSMQLDGTPGEVLREAERLIAHFS